MEELGVTTAIFVGDRLHDDIWGAQHAGLKAVWVRNDRRDPAETKPDAVIDRLAELPAAVADLI
jgi:putative hydrolase of the HAD superfamily